VWGGGGGGGGGVSKCTCFKAPTLNCKKVPIGLEQKSILFSLVAATVRQVLATESSV